jgi:hypothetical protein
MLTDELSAETVKSGRPKITFSFLAKKASQDTRLGLRIYFSDKSTFSNTAKGRVAAHFADGVQSLR